MVFAIQQFEPYQKFDFFRISINGICLSFGFTCCFKPKNIANCMLLIWILFDTDLYAIALDAAIISIFPSSFYNPQSYQSIGIAERYIYVNVCRTNAVLYMEYS